MKRLLTILTCFGVLESACVCSAAESAHQKIYLKSGETIEGWVDPAPDGSVRIQKGGARQTRSYLRTEIMRIEEYNDHGRVLKEYNYDGGLRHGEYKIYNSDGNLYEEGRYAHGQRDGVARQYFEDGKVRWEMTYENGRVIHRKTCRKVYDRVGSIISEIGYECDER